ncbi:acyl carrier protein [Paenibacillus thiaminolyticus]|jgi:methoxymalonate biosynthesis acyl carrier protein|uniref:Acyl carrier protein n=1 Tax=Paenibacillus thiaminolyticus TaxID=49283 RepID=A0A378ZD64_PANTH|nr:acyl carrier protein [Paenibacillus thiaminolyticus]MCY9534533.1 acyl carrier protein [Paenibacillus thiaminolyticus]MCY9604570.1 acyl carrier protein [Paenibacillus thiaminolyticus]MCY9610571.1 acyl carrier protein [Paenibacillus thiaminolyticus]MCY9614027.1 acyl carrier protein [Paenibacillus thiaminolyticus]MCY9618564.1 acyl carrier protein [Paenibacillus thiaminolyticus]
MEIKQKIREFIESNLVVFEDEAVFSDDDNIFQMGFVNSLFAMKLLGYIEQEFGITVGNEDLDIANFSTLNNIVRLIAKHMQEV